jgi:hypothetical protein
MNENQTPLRTHGLHLATDATVGEAWEQFFCACWDAWEVLQKRREAKKVQQVENQTAPTTSTEEYTQA